MNRKKVWIFSLAAALALFAIPGAVLCADYPTREIEFVSGFGPGSSNDSVARLIGKFSEKYVGKPIVVVNKAGGGGTRGYAFVAAAKPDGYTLGNLNVAVIFTPYLVKGVTYDYKKSFRIISKTAIMPIGLYVKKGGPYDIPLKELVKKFKEKPNTIKIGVGGNWVPEDIVRAVFEDEAGVQGIRVPFTGGGGETIPALLGGHTDINFGGASHWAELYRSGKVNVLATTLDKRDPGMPNIPTFKENGFDMAGIMNIYWVGAPAGTPDAVVNHLAEAFRKGLADPGYAAGMANLGCTAAWEGPADSLKEMNKIEQTFLKLVKKYNLQPQ